MACFALAGTSVSVLAGKDAWPCGRGSLRTSVRGVEVPRSLASQVAVDQEVGVIDAARLTLFGAKGRAFAQGVALGDDLSVQGASGFAVEGLFGGEVVEIEPAYEPDGSTHVVIRALNRLHRLTRGTRSRTFSRQTDAEIVQLVATENALDAAPSPELIEVHDTVVQQNQTDLEFLRARAAPLGYEVFVIDRTLHFSKRVDPPTITLAPICSQGDARLLEFRPRLSSTETVQRVTVRGWDPVKKQEIVGTATAPTVLLVEGEDDPDLLFGLSIEIRAGESIQSEEEAEALAREELARANEASISAEAQASGHPGLGAGMTIEIAGAGARFDGKYYVTGTTHRYSDPSGGDGGYKTSLRLRRLDGALFHLPEVDDEVLVAFEHGDMRRPVVVGSLWNDDDPPPSVKRR